MPTPGRAVTVPAGRFRQRGLPRENYVSAENPYAAPSANLDRPDDYKGYGELNFFTVQGRIGRLRYLAWAAGLVLLVFPVFIVLGTIMA